MSDVASRPAASRGRGSARGGRGAFSGRGGGGGRASNRPAATNGDSKHDSDALPTLDDQGEIGDLKKLHGSKVSLIKDVVPEWSDVDILYALKETDGNADLTVERIFDGSLHLPPPHSCGIAAPSMTQSTILTTVASCLCCPWPVSSLVVKADLSFSR